jgi:hypothetical protein
MALEDARDLQNDIEAAKEDERCPKFQEAQNDGGTAYKPVGGVDEGESGGPDWDPEYEVGHECDHTNAIVAASLRATTEADQADAAGHEHDEAPIATKFGSSPTSIRYRGSILYMTDRVIVKALGVPEDDAPRLSPLIAIGMITREEIVQTVMRIQSLSGQLTYEGDDDWVC